MNQSVAIKFNNWAEYNKRAKEYKHPVWFSFSNDFATNKNFHSFTDSERLIFIYLLCEASKENNNGQLIIDLDHFSYITKQKIPVVNGTINKLIEKQIVTFWDRDGIVTGSHDDPDLAVTGQYRTEQNKDECNSVASPLFKIWNENRGQLGEAKAMSSKRKQSTNLRWKENPSEEYWINIVNILKRSTFCNGDNDRGWKADFDFFIKPDTHLKALEGKYNGKQTLNKKTIITDLPKEY